MTTPGPSPETLAAARIAGVDRVFVIGGAQAVAALAYGTESVPRVDKIVGPGNAYVTAAKRLVYGDVGIDFLAGPTEVAIAADASADPAWVAADLLAQAEHDVLAVPVLVAVGLEVAQRVAAEVDRQLAELPRRQIAEAAMRAQGVAFVVDSAEQAIAAGQPHRPRTRRPSRSPTPPAGPPGVTAGAVFVGHHASESVGDYFAGPSHVLPTGGSARFSSPLGVGDFLKRTSHIEYTPEALAAQAEDIQLLTAVEGLDGHGRAVSIRVKPLKFSAASLDTRRCFTRLPGSPKGLDRHVRRHQNWGKTVPGRAGETIRVEKLTASAGDKLSFEPLLFADDAGKFQVGKPTVGGIKVLAEVVEQGLGKKITLFKYKRRKNYRRKQGHRQPFTAIKITAIGA